MVLHHVTRKLRGEPLYILNWVRYARRVLLHLFATQRTLR